MPRLSLPPDVTRLGGTVETIDPALPRPRQPSAILLFVVLLAVGVYELPNYGSAYDSIYGFPQGEALLQRLLTGRDEFTPSEAARCPFRIVNFRDLPDNTDRFPIDHGQFPTVLGALSCRLLHQKLGVLGVVDAHNLPILLSSLAVLILVYRLGLRSGEHSSAVWAVLLCASHPRYVVDSFVNYKDLTVTLFLLVLAIVTLRSLDRARPLEALVGFVALGLGMASKVSTLLGLAGIAVWAVAGGHARMLWRRQRLLVVPGLVLSLFLTWLFWPFLRVGPLWEHLAELVSRLAVHSSTARVGGNWKEHLLAAHAFRYFLIASPELYLAAVAAGAVYVLREPRDSRFLAARLALAIGVTFVAVFSAPGVFATDGLRYVLPAIPCLAVVGGIGLTRLIEFAATWVRTGLAGIFAVTVGVLLWVPVLTTHPFEITYFNWLSGGLRAAKQRELPGASDYWAISYRLVTRWLDHNASAGALLFTPLAPHLIAVNDELRPDLHLLRTDVDWCTLEPNTVYVFYTTREDLYWQNPLFAVAERQLQPVETFWSQGAPVVKIFRESSTHLCELMRLRKGSAW